jgi:hypothetical protein
MKLTPGFLQPVASGNGCLKLKENWLRFFKSGNAQKPLILSQCICNATLNFCPSVIWQIWNGQTWVRVKQRIRSPFPWTPFSVEFPLACYQQAGRVWYISGALRRTYTLFYPAPTNFSLSQQDKNWAEFSTLELAVSMLRIYSVTK